jgi:hypothetical protein
MEFQMTLVEELPGNSERLGPSELAVLASTAAVVLDDRARGREVELTPVNRLASWLRSTINRLDPLAQNRALIDPGTAQLLNRTFRSSPQSSSSIRIEVLFGQARDLGDRLYRVSEAPQREVQQLRDLCLAFSRAAQVESASRREQKPTSKFRR